MKPNKYRITKKATKIPNLEDSLFRHNHYHESLPVLLTMSHCVDEKYGPVLSGVKMNVLFLKQSKKRTFILKKYSPKN